MEFNMIERVARAMVAADSGPEGSTLFEIHWEEFGEGYTRTARAAIEAMREPTDAMIDCGVDGDDVVDIYQRMIDAALLEWESGDE